MTGISRRSVAALFVGVALVLGAAPASAHRAIPSQEEPEPTASIDLVARSAWIGEDRPLTLDVALSGDTADTTMRVRIHPPLGSSADLDTSLDADVGGITRTIDLGPTDEMPVDADGTRRIEITGDDIRLPGIHPVVVELRSAGEVVGLIRTPVIRLGSQDDPLPAPTLSLVVDVAVPPTLEPEGRRALTGAELDRLNRLAGFLDDLRALDEPPPVTLVMVPDTVEALAASTDQRAADVIDALRAAVALDSTTTVAHPYVPVSAAALVDADLGDVVDVISDTGSQVLADRLGAEPAAALWPDADVIPEAAAVLVGRGVRAVLTGSRTAADVGAEPPGDERGPLTPAGPRPVGALSESGIDAVVADDDLGTELMAPIGDRVDDPVVAVADLLLRDGGRGSDVVVRLDDAPAGSLVHALVPLLADPSSPVTTSRVPTGEPTPDADGEPPGPVTLPTGSADDLAPIADRYRDVAAGLGTFTSFVDTGSATAATLRLQLLTSVAEDLADGRRIALLDTVDTAVATGLGSLSLTGQTDLNLTSRTGSLPIAVQNDGTEPVRVMIRIRSDRLRFPDGEEFQVVAGPDITRIDVPVEALATGSVPTFVEIRTPDGEVLLDERQLNVRSTAVSGVGLALSLGALAVLAVWWVRTWRRGRNTD